MTKLLFYSLIKFSVSEQSNSDRDKRENKLGTPTD